jgi:hypothetical protein
MRHALVRPQGDVVARLDKLAIWETNSVLLDDFLGQRLRDWGRRLEGIEDGGSIGIIKLGVKRLEFGLRVVRVGGAPDC